MGRLTHPEVVKIADNALELRRNFNIDILVEAGADAEFLGKRWPVVLSGSRWALLSQGLLTTSQISFLLRQLPPLPLQKFRTKNQINFVPSLKNREK